MDWGVVFRDMAHRLAKEVGKPKPTPIFPFLFHLYEGQGLLTVDEELDYRTAKEMDGYRITPDSDSQHGTDEDEAVPTPVPSPQAGPSSRTPNRRRKSTYRAPAGSPPIWSRGPSSPVPPEPHPRPQQPAPRPESRPEGARPEEGQEWVEKPFVDVARSIRQARMQYKSMEEALEQISSELEVRPNRIIPTIRSLSKAREMEELRARIVGLLKDNAGRGLGRGGQERGRRRAWSPRFAHCDPETVLFGSASLAAVTRLSQNREVAVMEASQRRPPLPDHRMAGWGLS